MLHGTFERDNITFHYIVEGEGIPFIFQHGIGGDLTQPTGLFKPPSGFQLLSFDFRAHGKTVPIGDPTKLTFNTFADDLIAFMDHLNLPKAIVGGISMGAGVALNVALRYPERVISLVLSRPAWLDGPMSDTALYNYDQVTHLLRENGPILGKQKYLASNAYRKLNEESPDAAKSVAGQFMSTQDPKLIVRLEQLPREKPITNLNEVTKINTPTLILATKKDPIHPFEYAEKLANFISGSYLKELSPKSDVSKEEHANEVQLAIVEFLEKNKMR